MLEEFFKLRPVVVMRKSGELGAGLGLQGARDISLQISLRANLREKLNTFWYRLLLTLRGALRGAIIDAVPSFSVFPYICS